MLLLITTTCEYFVTYNSVSLSLKLIIKSKLEIEITVFFANGSQTAAEGIGILVDSSSSGFIFLCCAWNQYSQ